MDVRKIAEVLILKKFTSDQIGQSKEVDDTIMELLDASGFFDKIITEMEFIEERIANEGKGKPKTRAEWLEYIGEV
jgi:hypothetical protein